MTKPVISVEHLTKKYDLGVIGTGTISRDLNRWWARVRGQPDPYTRIGQRDAFERIGESILALDDVSFTVEQGEALGIIGNNGAGKSTLLKILSRVTAPTSGVVKVKGRIGSLLEVGTGFHPELTGRENIYLNGAILGMKKAEVVRKFDEIVDFAGVEKFIDTPVKRYSSGMYVRLAFAVAAHLESEILIVDEVLAVGDAEFQKKCLGKMGDVATQEGRTVLFVSHNMGAIQNLCKKSVLIQEGIFKIIDDTDIVISTYLDGNKSILNTSNYSTTGNIKFLNITLLRNKTESNGIFQTGDDLSLISNFSTINKITWFFVGADILDDWNQLIFAIHSKEAGLIIDDDVSNRFQVKVEIPSLPLLPGKYHFRIVVADTQGHSLIDITNATEFQVVASDLSGSGSFFTNKHGVVFMPFKITVESLEKKWTKEIKL